MVSVVQAALRAGVLYSNRDVYDMTCFCTEGRSAFTVIEMCMTWHTSIRKAISLPSLGGRETFQQQKCSKYTAQHIHQRGKQNDHTHTTTTTTTAKLQFWANTSSIKRLDWEFKLDVIFWASSCVCLSLSSWASKMIIVPEHTAGKSWKHGQCRWPRLPRSNV